ncbi:MAG: alcohol dehydrogenase catalytic domain-containing protein [Phycisphaerae bacterium]
MLAICFDGKVVVRRDYPRPSPARSDVLVEVRKAGICATDLEVAKGYMSFRGVMGHEFIGTVVAGSRQWKGKRVVAEINCVCRRCDMCRSGLSNHCRNRTVLGISGRDGCFAEYLTVPARNLHEVPDAISDDEAVFIEPVASALQLVRQVKLAGAQQVVVLGDGRLAQLIVRVLKGRVKRTVMVGRHAAKLEAAEKQGIQAVAEEDFVPSASVAFVVDATGSPSGFDLAMRTVRPRGTIVLKSTFAAVAGLNLTPLVINEVTLVGSRCGPFPDAIAALAAGKVDVSALISAEFDLPDALAALEAAGRGDKLKVLLNVRR